MDAKIKLLEERVSQAVDRIQNLADERRRLCSELETLREQAAEFEKDKTTLSGEFSGENWSRKASEIDGMIEEAIRALKTD
jgi:undecaprenyl pyrophosphate synthase